MFSKSAEDRERERQDLSVCRILFDDGGVFFFRIDDGGGLLGLLARLLLIGDDGLGLLAQLLLIGDDMVFSAFSLGFFSADLVSFLLSGHGSGDGIARSTQERARSSSQTTGSGEERVRSEKSGEEQARSGGEVTRSGCETTRSGEERVGSEKSGEEQARSSVAVTRSGCKTTGSSEEIVRSGCKTYGYGRKFIRSLFGQRVCLLSWPSMAETEGKFWATRRLGQEGRKSSQSLGYE
ncbi:hypothetical protein Syun_022138 [Stephania yunnanensis]|uniref:Uncharacterized protein n=1 Tax=Stephania yunnanensis TaxID=152371 RepID=A0AAP0IGZ2_9MAGN